jgi:hypothetical protein
MRVVIKATPLASTDKPCTCPSGDGSLRWPCPQHPPEVVGSVPAAIKTWRERIGADETFPLHAPTDVERAMVAQIQELEAALAQLAGAAPYTDFATWLAQHPELRGFTIGAKGNVVWSAAQQTGPAAARDVLAERRRQVDREGYDPEHDDEHVSGEIAAYAAFYAMPQAARDWPATESGYGDTWGEAIVPVDWTPPKEGDRRRELVKAGALILAEIERIDRAAVRTTSTDKEAS